jgi:hypothetical protein
MAAAETLALVESPVQLLNTLEWYADQRARADAVGTPAPALTAVVLAPGDPMTRGQLRRVAVLAGEEGITVEWQDARASLSALPLTAARLGRRLRGAERLLIGDPFSRLTQLLLPAAGGLPVTVVDDGTATLEFARLVSGGARLVRWHRGGRRAGPGELLFAPFAGAARRRLTPRGRREVELFTAMPVSVPDGMVLRANQLAWTRRAFGPPRIAAGTDIVGTSLVETGVLDAGHYLRAVTELAREHGARRYFAHRREETGKLRRLATEAGLEVVRPDLPLELVARRGPIGQTVLSFPSTVLHTLPLALHGTGVRVLPCAVDPAWLTPTAPPRAEPFLTGVLRRTAPAAV